MLTLTPTRRSAMATAGAGAIPGTRGRIIIRTTRTIHRENICDWSSIRKASWRRGKISTDNFLLPFPRRSWLTGRDECRSWHLGQTHAHRDGPVRGRGHSGRRLLVPAADPTERTLSQKYFAARRADPKGRPDRPATESLH